MAAPSNPTPTFSTLAEVRAWLATLVVGEAVDLGSANFTPAIAGQVFTVLPQSDPLSLTVTAVAIPADGGTLAGTATVTGVQGCLVQVAFAAADSDPLLATITVGLPESVVWYIIPDFALGLGGLSAVIAPETDVGAASFSLTGKLIVSGEPELSATLFVPAVAGADWTLSAAGLATPSQGLLTALAGDENPLSVLGDGFTLDDISLNGFTMAFSPARVTMFTLDLGYHTNWQPLGTDVFEVTGLEIAIAGHKPFDAGSMDGLATAKTKIATVPVDVSVKFPDMAVFASLDEGASLDLTTVFTGFHVTLPAGFPDIAISTLSFGIYALTKTINFTLGIDKPILIADGVRFDQFHFDLLISFQDGAFSADGDLFAQFSFGGGAQPTVVTLQGQYDSSGSLSLAATVVNLSIGDLVTGIARQFGIDADQIPGALSSAVLDQVTISFSRSSGVDKFEFLCAGHAVVADALVQFSPFLHVTYDELKKIWSLDVGGTLDLTDGQGASMTFDVEFVKSSSDTSLTATYASDDPLNFARIGKIFDLNLDDVPTDLDLDLTGLGISYDFTAKNLVIGARSSNRYYGSAVFLSQALAGSGPRQLVFLLRTAVDLDLSKLPLVGSALSEIGSLALKDVTAAIATPAPIAATAVGVLNTSIAKIGAGYPTVPATGLQDRLSLAATLEAGGSPPQAVAVSLLGPSQAPGRLVLASADPAALAAGDGGTKWFEIQKTFGPVSIQKVGLRYADNKLWALMNAELKAGPVDFGLLGLGIGSPLKSFEPAFSVDGITLAVAAGPVDFSGALVGQLSPLNLYGELSLTLPSFSIGALGGYAEYGGHPSCFIYGVLDAELGGPAFFFVTGLAAGFGFNRTLVIPEVGQLAQFPLISWAVGTGPSSTPTASVGDQVLKAMDQLTRSGVIAPSIGEYWIAAGVQFTSFKLIDSFALLTVKLGNEIEFDLLGLSTLALPPAEPEKIAVAQLALKASFAVAQSEISVTGQLTSASFVLSTKCHLTGGFAFCMWYGGLHVGDFVVSLGGYSPRYDKPSHYPPVPRLGINWQVSDELSVSGDEYFALTPSAVMAGGGLRAAWSSGAISAWFSIEADFLLLFNPTHYYLSATVEIGASVKVDLWFTSFTVSAHIGADAEIWGPPFTGKIRVDLDIVSFTIAFNGARREPPTLLPWDDFVAKVLPARPGNPQAALGRAAAPPEARAGADGAAAQPLVQITAPTGMLKTLPPVVGASPPLDWLVDGETLTISVTSTVPLNGDALRDDGNVTLAADPDDHGQPNLAIGVGPSGIAPDDLTSTLVLDAGASADVGATIYATQILSSVPKAVWENRALDANGVPVGVKPMEDTTIADALTGFILTPQTPAAQASTEIPLRYLAFTDDGPPRPLAWSVPVLPASDPFGGQTVHGTIASVLATGNRAALILAANRLGFALDAEVDVSSLADPTSGALLAAPLLRYLAEAR